MHPFSPTATVPYTGTVASVTDANVADAPTSFQQTSIDWGENTQSPGTVSGTPTTFSAQGTHTYATPGSYRMVAAGAHTGSE